MVALKIKMMSRLSTNTALFPEGKSLLPIAVASIRLRIVFLIGEVLELNNTI